MKKFIKFLSDSISLVANVRQLERDVENLEDKVLAPEEVPTRDSPYWINQALMSWIWDEKPTREMTLEEKVDALAELLKVRFQWTEEKEKVLTAEKVKQERRAK